MTFCHAAGAFVALVAGSRGAGGLVAPQAVPGLANVRNHICIGYKRPRPGQILSRVCSKRALGATPMTAIAASTAGRGEEGLWGGMGRGRITSDESRRLKAEWLVDDTSESTSRVSPQPWELGSLSPEEQASHLGRGLLQMSATFGWCLTDEEGAQLETYKAQVAKSTTYLPAEQQRWVDAAAEVAYFAHQRQMRKSGEPFIVHPMEVMEILAGLKMDAETLVAGLLHDTVEDTPLAFQDIEAQFGSTVRRIVEGETKLSKIPGRVSAFRASAFEMEQSSQEEAPPSGSARVQDPESVKQADNLRHMLIAMSKDWRVLVVKLADRLHNMRTISAMPSHKQERISHETMGVFVPLARRMGLWGIKTELEDLCFRALHSSEHERVTRLMEHRMLTTGHSEEVLENERQRLQEVLSRTAALEGEVATFEVKRCTKPAYNVWRAMQRNGGNFYAVLDAVSYKVVFRLRPRGPGVGVKASAGGGVARQSFENSEREKAACYRLLEALHGLLPPINPPRVEDYIAVPRPNRYRALHSTVFLRGYPVEVQILTGDMEGVASFGIASSQVARQNGDLKDLPWLAELQTSAEALALGCGDTYSASVRRSLTKTQERRFVFDPEGKILDLAGDARVRDAARELHDAKHCRVVGAYVNSRLVPLNHPLKNGDVIAIVTAPYARAPGFHAEEAVAAGGGENARHCAPARPVVDLPVHVHTGVWPWSMVDTINEGGEPDTLKEIDPITPVTPGERAWAREVELKHARL
ncbi:unnamed protein product, partial [Discosporangium mesarthrocarpum]